MYGKTTNLISEIRELNFFVPSVLLTLAETIEKLKLENEKHSSDYTAQIKAKLILEQKISDLFELNEKND